MTDFRALCADLLRELDHASSWDYQQALKDQARAALAQPEPEGPTDEELLRTYGLAKRDHNYEGPIDDWPKRAERAATVAGLRAVLARWGTPNSAEARRSLGDPAECPACEGRPAPSNTPCAVCGTERPTPQPANGEVAELVAWLWDAAEEAASADWLADAQHLNRAAALLSRLSPPQPVDAEVAELVASLERMSIEADAAMQLSDSEVLGRAATILERLSPPQPIPVSERLPGSEDCDAEGRCWLCGKVEGDWRLLNPDKSGVPQLKYCFSHWLPAHALPAPIHTSESD